MFVHDRTFTKALSRETCISLTQTDVYLNLLVGEDLFLSEQQLLELLFALVS